ncbi:hypothetical protein [Microbulbifer sp. Q7]|uniref:polysaccharide pyruvyl transferase family protein n=1 Tax=Microbulbifer sp. Q7 TaxID=1785091 RepID=UPI000835A0EE|nr:hypothetical protein [Microbulbifer sp. Q7]
MGFYFYALKESIGLLRGVRQKALLVGSDFGYGNFGDVLQHVSAISFLRDNSNLAIVSVNSIATIPKLVDIERIQDSYGVDCLLFVSEAPLSDDSCVSLGLEQVTSLHNVSYVQLYGGGFLNELWGEYVIGVAEAILERLDNPVYLISGQQVSEGFVDSVVTHIQRFNPVFIGVRDYRSEKLLKSAGVDTEFSFDDAVEPLLKMRELLQVEAGPGMIFHLNISDYTGNDAAILDIKADLAAMSRVSSGSVPVTLLQAYRDQREEVVDSIESVKRLGGGVCFF